MVKIALDLDNTTADFTGAMRDFLMSQQGGTKVMEAPASYNYTNWDLGEYDSFADALSAAERDGIYVKMQPNKGAVEKINELVDSGCEIHVLTARPECYRDDTVKFLEKFKIPYQSLTFSGDKERFKFDLFIDDSPSVLQRLIKANKRVVIMGKRYNKHVGSADSLRLSRWSDLEVKRLLSVVV